MGEKAEVVPGFWPEHPSWQRSHCLAEQQAWRRDRELGLPEVVLETPLHTKVEAPQSRREFKRENQ